GRGATAKEEARWTRVLRKQGRLAVGRALEHTRQGRTFLVRKWFQLFFGQTPKGQQAASFVRPLVQGQSGETVLGRLLGSPRSTRLRGVRLRLLQFYLADLLGRSPKPAEVARFVNGLNGIGQIRQLLEIGQEFYLHGR